MGIIEAIAGIWITVACYIILGGLLAFLASLFSRNLNP